MCDRSFMLVVFLILKIIILIITPILLYFLYKKESKVYNLVGGLDIFFIILFIILKLTGNTCINNSTFSYINSNRVSYLKENYDSFYESILSSKQYVNKNNEDVYYYSISNKPLSDVKLSCDEKKYMKNYGDSITTITTLLSNNIGLEINEIDVISYLEKNKIIDCENDIDFDKVIKGLQDKYHYTVSEIKYSDLYKYVFDGNSVLVETKNKYDKEKNFGCEKDYIIVYNINNDGVYSIINPNDKQYDYFCPSNTIGYGSVIEGNQNDKTYSLDDINDKALKYYVIEVR